MMVPNKTIHHYVTIIFMLFKLSELKKKYHYMLGYDGKTMKNNMTVANTTIHQYVTIISMLFKLLS